MEKWIDLGFLNEIIHILDGNLLRVFGINAVFVQFGLVFILMMTLMVVLRPIIEWLMIHNWNTLASYVVSALMVLVFLQLVDRYARVAEQSTLPSYYWSVCLLAISGFGMAYTLVKVVQKAWKRLSKRSKKKAA